MKEITVWLFTCGILDGPSAELDVDIPLISEYARTDFPFVQPLAQVLAWMRRS